MTRPLHDYIAGLIANRLRDRGIVVIHDPSAEFRPFFKELSAGAEPEAGLRSVRVGQTAAKLFVVAGSMLEARATVESLTAGDEPTELIIYSPGVPRADPRHLLLMELEKAGIAEALPPLKSCARYVLRKRLDDAAIDGMLGSDALTYQDYSAICADGDSGGSLLQAVFESRDPSLILAAWLATPGLDGELERKGGWGELRSLVLSRFGLDLPRDAGAARLRALAARYALANAFRADLADGAALVGQAAALVSAIPETTGKDSQKAVGDVVRRLRERYPEAYVGLADEVQRDLNLEAASIDGGLLGSADTFRFEESSTARSIIAMVADGQAEQARALLETRSESFWTAQDPARQALWQVCRLMVDVCLLASRVRREVDSGSLGGAAVWVERYASGEADGWFMLDLAQRRFETLLSAVEEDIDPTAVAAVRSQYEDAVRRMTEGFVKALEKATWAVPGVLHHTRIWPDVVAARAKPVAYIFVDAMRYEMGFELAERIGATNEVQLRPALAALPSITPVGMAALLPGAASSYSVVQEGGKLGARIENAFLPDRAARQKFLAAKAPDAVSMQLDDVVSLSPANLRRRIGDATLIAIHSTEIDAAGENGFSTASARRIMDNVIGDLAQCLRKLAAAGVSDAVITADHGHLFFDGDRPAAMRMDAPGGETVDLHRRCWIGRGGATPPGAVRVSGAALGYATDLDFVFPVSTAVFKAGGDLAFHHGGPSLQELVIPVLSVKTKQPAASAAAGKAVVVTHDFDAITNRIFMVKIELAAKSKDLFAEARAVRPVVTSAGREVAQARLAAGADLRDGRLALSPQASVTVGFMLTDDEVKSVRIQVLDAETDAILYASGTDIPVKLGL